MGQSMIGFLNVNQGLTNLNGESRQYRLPKTNPFPKLNKRIQGPAVRCEAVGTASVPTDTQGGELPEMATDLIDLSANYAVENVKRDRKEARPWSRVGLSLLVGRMLGGHRAARP